MAKRRSQVAMTENEQREYLEHGESLQVATIGPNGWPHMVTMHYVLIDGLIHFTTYQKSQKIVNLQRNPKISCMIESGDDYSQLRGLVMKGEAEIIEDDPALTGQVLSMITEKHHLVPAGGNSRAAEEARARIIPKRATVRIHPTSIYSWDHTKLGGRY